MFKVSGSQGRREMKKKLKRRIKDSDFKKMGLMEKEDEQVKEAVKSVRTVNKKMVGEQQKYKVEGKAERRKGRK